MTAISAVNVDLRAGSPIACDVDRDPPDRRHPTQPPFPRPHRRPGRPDAIRPGVLSIPHGWGHDADGAQLTVAAAHAGSNTNVLTDELEIDPLSGNAVLNGIPVTVVPA